MHSYKHVVLVLMIIYIFTGLYIPTIPVLFYLFGPKKLPIVCFLFSKHVLTSLLTLLTQFLLRTFSCRQDISLIIMRVPQTITFITKPTLLTLATIPLLSLISQSLYQSVISVESKGTSLQNVLELKLNL